MATFLDAFICQFRLSKITCDILSKLYGDNTGSHNDLKIFETLRLAFDVAWKLSAWRRSVPEDLRPRISLISTEPPLTKPTASLEAEHLQAVMALRFHGICALGQRPVLIKFLVFESDCVDADENFLCDSGVASLRACIRSCTECITPAKDIVDQWRDQRVLLSGAWWQTAYHAFGASLIIFGILLISTKLVFADLLSAEEIKAVHSSLRDASELLSPRLNDTLVILRCHGCLENFLQACDDLVDPSRPRHSVGDACDTEMPPPALTRALPSLPSANGSGLGVVDDALATAAHDAEYIEDGFTSFDIESFVSRPFSDDFTNFDWGDGSSLN
ncbi:hypothetical protein B0H63DRAFT_529704 [Podospora didyma]|uniref:Transcription factor domain-containing protein n=1 Tax=Podospora didyma TaxID=330526 RepID=A0AAE0K1R3_9PEZI|nr:hypothetical protein B0H63DRAFT_529704 [Podospora didyma]